MTKYKCPKCGMEYDEPGKCTMDGAVLVKAEDGKTSDHDHSMHKNMIIQNINTW